MPRNLKSLLDNPENLPEINARGVFADADIPYVDRKNPTMDETYPAYSHFLKNARNSAIEKMLPNYIYNKNNPREFLDKGMSVPSGLGPEFDQVAAHDKFKKTLVADPRMKMNFDRQNINQEIIGTYLNETHPEQIQNRKMTLRNTNRNPAELDELSKYQQQLALDMVGPLKNEPKYEVSSTPGYNGWFDPRINTIQMNDPFQVSTPVHERLHAKEHEDFNPPNYEEITDIDLLGSENLAQDMTTGNNSHLRQFLNEQTGPKEFVGINDLKPPGESAFYYNKIREHLNRKK